MSLKIARKIAKLTQTDLARRSQVDPATINRLENGTGDIRNSPYPTVAAIAAVLNLTPEELVTFLSPPTPARKRGPRPSAPHADQAASR